MYIVIYVFDDGVADWWDVRELACIFSSFQKLIISDQNREGWQLKSDVLRCFISLDLQGFHILES
jgi:hypothetical protein